VDTVAFSLQSLVPTRMRIVYACMVAAASGQSLEGLKNVVVGASGSVTAQPPADPLEQMDLTCMKNVKNPQTWINVQQKFQYILGPSAGFVPLNKENTLEPAVTSIMQDIESLPKENEGECAIGQLMLQLLKIITVDSDGELIGQIKSKDQISSPILTLLLDVPWSTYQPEWPMFGLLAQAAVKRSKTHTNNEAIDGLVQPELKQFASAMNRAIGETNLENLRGLSQAFIDSGADGAMQASPIGYMTAVFTQAATAPTKQEAKAVLSDAQILLKSMITSPADLEASLGSQWPMWGMAYLASLKASV